MDAKVKEPYTIAFGSGVVWHENHVSLLAAKRSATKGLVFGAGDVAINCPDGSLWVRLFWQNPGCFGWESWERTR